MHLGHLIVAEDLRQRLGLQEILFAPAGQPWLKKGQSISAAEDRLEMVILATASNPYLNVSTIEIERRGPTYSIDTIVELKAGLGAGAKIYFIAGYDALAELHRWKAPKRLVEMCQVVGIRRPGYDRLDIRTIEASVPGALERIKRVEVPQVDISSKDLKK